MNTPNPTLAERLRSVPEDRLSIRLQRAREALMWSQTPFQRGNAIRDIAALRAEMERRGIGTRA